jgi:D-alanyl-D-alanine carboxypeptidase
MPRQPNKRTNQKIMNQRRTNNIFIACIFWLMLSPVVSIGQQTQTIINNPNVASNLKLLDTWLQTQIRYGKMPGVSVGIVYNGELIYQKGFGYADVEKKTPSTPDSRYRIASQTKLFTAIGIMILRDEGKLSLDDPIEKYLSWLKLKPYNENDPPVSIRQLLSHSSGLSRDIEEHWTGFQFPTKEEFRRLAKTNLHYVYSPNSKWKYSNNAYTLLGEIIEVASGKLYKSFINEKILQPLSMSATSVTQDKEYQNTLATGYSRKLPDNSRQNLEYIDAKAGTAMCGMASSVTDLAKFVAWQMRLLYENKTEILKPNTLKEMQRIQFMDEETRCGLGFEIYHKGNDNFICKAGSYPGYRTCEAINVAEKIGVVVCINGSDGEAYLGTAWSISERIFDWLTPAIKSTVQNNPQTVVLNKYKEFEGLYGNIWNESYVIYLDGKLQIVNPNTPDPKSSVYILDPIATDRFKIVSGPRFTAIGEELLFKRNTQEIVDSYFAGDGWKSVKIE